MSTGVEGDMRWLILRDRSGMLLGGKGRIAAVKQAERQAGAGGRELTLWCPGSPRGVLSRGVTEALSVAAQPMWPAGREESGHSQSRVREVGVRCWPQPRFPAGVSRAWEWVLHVSLSIKEAVTGIPPWTWPSPWLHLEVEQTEEEG